MIFFTMNKAAGIEPMGIGAKFVIGLDLADCAASEPVASRICIAMAGAALAHKNVAATRHGRRIGLMRAWRRLQRLEPSGHAIDRVEINRIRRDAGSDRRR